MLLWSVYNIFDFDINEYSTKNTLNSSINKCYMKKKSDIFYFNVDKY
jgi:hypothetical protein